MKKTFLTVLLFYIFTGIAVAQNLSKTTSFDGMNKRNTDTHILIAEE